MLHHSISRRQMLCASVLATTPFARSNVTLDKFEKDSTNPLSDKEIALIEDLMEKKGRYIKEEGVYNLPMPRNDLRISIQGETVPIAFGFIGMVSFKKTLDGKQTVIMSELVLTEDEVNPLIDSAYENGLEVAGVYHHFFNEEPRIFYLHLIGKGEISKVTKAFASTLKPTKVWPAKQPELSEPFPNAKGIFNLPAIDAIVKQQGRILGQVYQYDISRKNTNVTCYGTQITASMGLSSKASFYGSPSKAQITGNIAMLANEVGPVIKALRENKLVINAIHHPMIGEKPEVLFLYYYGQGEVLALAKGFKAALLALD